jgi:hypothetical protein
MTAPNESNPIDRDPDDMGKSAMGESAKNDPGSHEQARQLTEKALDAMVHGDENSAGDMVDQAKSIDPTAVQEVMDDLEEDAGSDHKVPKENR